MNKLFLLDVKADPWYVEQSGTIMLLSIIGVFALLVLLTIFIVRRKRKNKKP